jgi:cyclohexanone monooxygenase
VGRDGLRLSDAWAHGMRSLHGMHVHGFPNAFFVQPAQGANLISNVPHNLTEAGRTIALLLRHAQDHGHHTIEVTQAAQDAWVQALLTGPGRMIGGPDCTPGYYNNEGAAPTEASKYAVGYPAGASAFFQYLKGWRETGRFEGLAFG